MIISIRTRRDVVVMDPDRLLIAARQALRDRDPGLTDAEATGAVTDVYDAVHALLDRTERWGSPGPRPPIMMHGLQHPPG